MADALPHAGLGRQRVPLARSVGRILAEDVELDHDVPPFRRATMDGYALAADPPLDEAIPVTGGAAAGDAPGATLRPGRAFRVMTGAPMPEGAVRVVPFEWTDEGVEAVRVKRLPSDDPFVVEAGAHARCGEIVLSHGTRIDAAMLGALATAGCTRPFVTRAPRVTVVSTGDELVPVSERPAPGRIRNSNGPLLVALAAAAGAVPRDAGIAFDDAPRLTRALEAALHGADVVLTSGGVSRGDRDLVPKLLASLGVETLFHGWAVQPGGPLWCGARGSTIVVGLPGNPAGAQVGFELLVRPVLDALGGLPLRPRATVRALYDGPWGRPTPRRRLRPADLVVDADGTLHAIATPWRGSGDPFALAHAAAWAVLSENEPEPAPEARFVDAIAFTPPRMRDARA